MPANKVLLRVADAVSDGTPVDWDAAVAEAATPAERTQLAQLRVLEEIARFHCPELDATMTLDPGLSAEPNMAGEHWGRLELRQLLGSGAFGRVYEAWDASLQREVALKLLEPGKVHGIDPESYLREGRLMARVRHPNVAQVYGADVVDGAAGIWMELIRGRTLESQLSEEGPFAENEATRIGIELCRGLAAVHAAGVVHRDVKTSNVMRERGGRIVLMDLGAGLATGTEAARAGVITGTPYYMAPELLRGVSASAGTDIYSLGVVLFRLVSVRFPVEGGTLAQLIDAHETGRRSSLRDLRPTLAPEFIRIVERATSPDPAERFASVGALQAALEAFALAQPLPARAPSRRRLATIAIFAILAVAAATAATFLLPRAVHGDLDAVLYRTMASGRQRLHEGDAVGPGDRLSMTLQAPEKVYAYVLNEDDSGKIYLLFPLSGLEPTNPLPAGSPNHLPGTLAGKPQAWVVSGSGGNERFLVVASRAPLTELEADLAALPRPTAESAPAYAELSHASERRLRSVGGLIGDDTKDGGPTAIFDRLERLGGDEAHATGVWVRHIKLRSR